MSSVNWWISRSFCGSLRRLVSLLSQSVVALTSRAVDAADHLAGDLARAHPPLGVEREPDVGLLEVLAQALGLGEEVAAAGLDVEDQQRLGLAGGLQVAADDRIRLAQVVAAVLAGAGGGDDRDQLHRRHHGPRLALVALGLLGELACVIAAGEPMPSAPSSLVLRRAVVGDDAVVREDLAPAARELRSASASRWASPWRRRCSAAARRPWGR